ncbi:glycerophosphodiester phosphodiesterase [Streptomyces virginiae]|uniref:glycerophosphodiester phosphodiesterase n=1 Tax=Streptomyces virginiae TaxID=1961 RepID=UPI00365D3D20
MTIPAGIKAVRVTGRFRRPDGTPYKGTISFLAPALIELVLALTVISGKATAELDENGEFSVLLVATDNPGMNPTGWVYTATLLLDDGTTRSWPVAFSATDTEVDVTKFMPADPAQINYVPVKGDRGDRGASILSGNGQPAPGTGADGDFWMELAANDRVLYGPKKNGTWPAAGVPLGGASGGLLEALNAAVTSHGQALAAHTGGSDPHGDRAWAATQFLPRAVVTPADLLSTTPFFVAHRGGGMEDDEHTLGAYRSAAAVPGIRAIEVSVNISADGVPVCLHDTTLDRTTNAVGSVGDWTYQALRHRVRTNGQALLGAGRSNQELPTLREVLDELGGKVVIFLEAKTPAAASVVQQMLTTHYPWLMPSLVWKAHYKAGTFAWARARNMTCWAYIDAATTDAELDAMSTAPDWWGVPHTMTDARIGQIVARNRPVICWEVHRRSDVTRLTSLGVRGMMCAQPKYVMRTGPLGAPGAPVDWPTMVKAPGDMGSVVYSPPRALHFDEDGSGGVRIDTLGGAVLIGSRSLSSYPASGYRIDFEMKYAAAPPALEHGGIAFGKAADDPYGFGTRNPSGGYHLAVRGNGEVQLLTHPAGDPAGTKIGFMTTAPPTAGTWMRFQIDLTPAQVTVRRLDGVPSEFSVADTSHRGGYVHLSNGSITSLTTQPHWRGLALPPL